jgi:hypothetical protein
VAWSKKNGIMGLALVTPYFQINERQLWSQGLQAYHAL